MAERPKKYFVLIKDDDGPEVVFHNAQPRGAALKAASRGETDIQLRERGTKRVHVFKGWREKVKAPANSPAWLPKEVWKANVKKQGVKHL